MIHIEMLKEGQQLVIDVIKGEVWFNTFVGGRIMRNTIDGVQMLPADLVREFPDLEGKSYSEMRKEAIRRFKEKVMSFSSEKDLMDYLVSDLEKGGYSLVRALSGSEVLAYARKHGVKLGVA